MMVKALFTEPASNFLDVLILHASNMSYLSLSCVLTCMISKSALLLTVTTPVQELPTSTRFAIYSDQSEQLWDIASYEGVQCELNAGGSDIFTIVPIQAESGAAFAPIGLTNMLNTGGAISAWRMDSGSASFKVQIHPRMQTKVKPDFCNETRPSKFSTGA